MAVAAQHGREFAYDLGVHVEQWLAHPLAALVARELLGTGASEVEVERVFVYLVRDGRFVECWVHGPDQAMIDRLVCGVATHH